MRYTIASLASLAATSHALGPRGEQCSFHLKADGSASGNVGQLGSGQTRIGLDPATFKLDGDSVSDDQGRGCWWTPPTKVFQCDVGQIPEKGWKIECDGSVSFNGQKDFFQCDAENGEYNVYLEDGHGQDCGKVTLWSDGCAPECAPKEDKTTKVEQPKPPKETEVVTKEQPKPSKVTQVVTQIITEDCASATETQVVTKEQPKPSQETKFQTKTKVVTLEQPKPPKETQTLTQEQPKPPKQTQPPKQDDNSCPTDLSGTYEYPHLIIPVDSSNPDKAAGTSYNGEVNSKISSIFNFDIPSAYKGKTCSLVFLFPKKEDLETSDWKLSGSGEVDFCKLEGVADEKTTYNNAPGVESDLKTVKVEAGNGYSIATFDCPAGEAVSFEIKGKGDTSLWFFEDYNPSPLGLYITAC